MGNDKLYIEHILEAVAKIEKFTASLTFEKFADNEMVLSAVMRELGVIGEASKKLSEEFKNNHLAVPWKEIAGMRDKLIRDYFEIDVEAVWKTIQEDIVSLKEELQR